jgi:cyclase
MKKSNLKKRIIPCLDVTNNRVVKGVNFVDLKDAGDPVELGHFYDLEGADELVFLDITASSDRRNIVRNLVSSVAEKVFIPYTVGGGINDLATIRDIIKNGADKVSINTAALKDPDLITMGAESFGSQCIVVAIDARRITKNNIAISKTNIDNLPEALMIDDKSQFEVYIHGGRTPTAVDAVRWAKYVEQLGAGEILLTSMDRDGTQIGYDLELTAAVKDQVQIPVIASGGAGKIEHLVDVLKIADAALLASLLHYRTLTVKQIKDRLIQEGIEVRSF